MDLRAAKLLVALAIWVAGFLSVMAPLALLSPSGGIGKPGGGGGGRATSSWWFSVGNAMAAGVLLSAGLTHQLPDAARALEGGGGCGVGGRADEDFLDEKEEEEERYPWSGAIAGLTFVLFLALEEWVHGQFGGDGHGLRGRVRRGRAKGDPPPQRAQGGEEDDDEFEDDNNGDGLRRVEMVPLTSSARDPTVPGGKHPSSGRGGEGKEETGTLPSISMPSHHERNSGTGKAASGAASPSEPASLPAEQGRNASSVLASLVLFLALSLHSILAGLSVGASPRLESVFSTTIAILAHKTFAGYALGSTLASSGLGRAHHLKLGAGFSLSTPLGILLGMAARYMGRGEGAEEVEDEWGVGVIQAAVAGTFLYVSIVEVGMREFRVGSNQGADGDGRGDADGSAATGAKLLAFLAGYAAMAGLAAVV